MYPQLLSGLSLVQQAFIVLCSNTRTLNCYFCLFVVFVGVERACRLL